MNFNLELLPSNDLKQVNAPHGRYYETPTGLKFYSVTTLLGKLLNDPESKAVLERWKSWIGEEKAARILVQAGIRGTVVHDALERFLRNEKNVLQGLMPLNRITVGPMMEILSQHVTAVYGLEHRLYSEKLLCSGTADCIALWDDELAVIDFKTARSSRHEKDILGYFFQSTAYALMCYERHKILPRKIVIIIAIDHEKPKVFVKNTGVYARRVVELFKLAPPVEV